MRTTIQTTTIPATAARAADTRIGTVIARAAAITALAVNAAIHLYLTPDHLEEAPYIGVGFLALSVATLLLATGLVVMNSRLLWTGVAAVNVAGLVAFVASRTIGLPQIADEVGEWGDPLGIATIAVEALAFVVAVAAVRTRGRS